MAEGIRRIHSRNCATRRGGRCDCGAGFEASVFSSRDGKKIRKTLPTLAAARAWRADAVTSVRRGTIRAVRPRTLREAADELLDGMVSGHIRTRSGDVYKPSVIRSYAAALRLYLLPELAGSNLADIQRRDVQRLADEMLASGLDPSTIRNSLMPLRVIYRRALEDAEVAVNPCSGIRLPAVRGRRDRVVSATEAAELLAALPRADRPLWALALYAGLRRGELMALRWTDVDLGRGIITVERAWDVKSRVFVEPKSWAGRRRVPIPAVLRDFLVDHRLDATAELLLGRYRSDLPFDPSSALARARKAWREAGLRAITLHEARHTFASLMIAAGVNARALSSYMGHASVAITYDRYGHLMPGNEDEAAALLDAYLARATTQEQAATVDR